MPFRHPLEAALQARSLAVTTGHPVVAGFGPGAAVLQKSVLGAPYASPLTAVREYLTIVGGLLAGQAVEHQGEYFSCRINMGWQPGPPVELGLGVLRPAMARLAGELADVAITWLTPAGYLRDVIVPALREGARAAGRPVPRLAAIVPVALSAPDRDPADLVLAANSGHLSMPHYQDMLRRSGIEVDPGQPRRDGQGRGREQRLCQRRPRRVAGGAAGVSDGRGGRDRAEHHRGLPAVRPARRAGRAGNDPEGGRGVNPRPFEYQGVPELGISRMLLVVTGSVSAADLPFWVEWLRASYPDLQIRVVVTRSAERFVTRVALAGRSGGEAFLDAWPDDESVARHVEWERWAQAIVVYPATLNFIARLALGLADTPAMLAAQCATVPVVLAPALPPGGLDSAAYQLHWTALHARRNVAVAPPRPGASVTTGQEDAWVPALMPDVLELVEQRRVELATGAGAVTAGGGVPRGPGAGMTAAAARGAGGHDDRHSGAGGPVRHRAAPDDDLRRRGRRVRLDQVSGAARPGAVLAGES